MQKLKEKLSGRLKSFGRNIGKQIKFYNLLAKDKRTPKIAKLFLKLAIGYAFFPFDLIPDFIPIMGHLDDLIIISALVFLAVTSSVP